MPISERGSLAKKCSTWERFSLLVNATGSPGSFFTAWAWKTPFATSKPTRYVIASPMDGLPSAGSESSPASVAQRCREGAVHLIIPGLVPGSRSSTHAGASCTMDPGDERRDDNVG